MSADRPFLSPVQAGSNSEPGRTIMGGSFGPLDINRQAQKDVEPSPEGLSRAIITDLRGFNAWLQRRSSGNDFCIDTDVLPKDEYPIDPIEGEEAIRRLKLHRASIAQIPPEERSDILTLTDERLRGVIAVREEMERMARGEPKSPYIPFFREVNGYNPSKVPESELNDVSDELYDSLGEAGQRPASKHPEDIALAINSYHESNKLTTPKAVEDEYWRFAGRYRSKLFQATGWDPIPVNYKWQTKFRNEFWKMYERIGPDASEQWFNWHERHRDSYDRALAQAYSIHEDDHHTKGTIYRQLILAGELDPLAGIFTIPGPDSYLLEGEAMQIQELAGYKLESDTRLGTTLYYLTKIAMANGIYRVEEGEPIEAVANDLAKYLPLDTLEGIGASLEEATTKTFDRAYQPVYGIAGYEFRQISGLERKKAIKFLNYTAVAPKTRSQIQELLGYIVLS